MRNAFDKLNRYRYIATPRAKHRLFVWLDLKVLPDCQLKLNDLRGAWLNPPEWADWVRTAEEEAAGFPPRPVARPGHQAELKKRTLTNLYNARSAWLDHARRELDAAIAAAYGWADYTADMPDDEILKRLLALNLEREATRNAGRGKAAAQPAAVPA